MPPRTFALGALLLSTLCWSAAASAAAGCSAKSPPANGRLPSGELNDRFGKVAPADRPLRIVFASPAASDPDVRRSLAGIEAEAKRLGATLQTASLDAAMAAAPDVLVLGPGEGDRKRILAEAAGRGVPTVAVGAQVAGARVSVAPDQPLFGAMAAEYLHELFPPGAGVGQLAGPAGTPDAAARADGFAKAAAEYPGLALAGSVAVDGTKDRAREATVSLMAAHPDIKGIYAGNDEMAVGAVEALKTLKLFDVVVIGTGGDATGRAALAQRSIKGTVARFPEREGALAVQVGLRLVGCQPLPAWIVPPQVTMTPKSFEDFAPLTQ